MGKKLTQKQKHQLELGWIFDQESMDKYYKDIYALCKRHHLDYEVGFDWEGLNEFHLYSLPENKVSVEATCRNFYELVGFVRGLLYGAYKVDTQHTWGDGIPETGEEIKEEDYSFLMNKPVHIMEDGLIEQQGSIIGVDLDARVITIQLYSFVDGGATTLKHVQITDLLDKDKYRVYSSDNAWHTAYCEQLEAQGLLSGSVDYNVSLMGERVRDK